MKNKETTSEETCKQKIYKIIENINKQELLESIYWFVRTIFENFND